MLFGNAHVKQARREGLLEGAQACRIGHRRRDGDNALIFLSKFRQQLPGRRAEAAGGGRGAGFAVLRVKGRHAVRAAGVVLRHRIALALGGHNVQQHGLIKALGAPEEALQALFIMPVHRAQVAEAEGVEKSIADEEVADVVLAPLQQAVQRLADQGNHLEGFGHDLL